MSEINILQNFKLRFMDSHKNMGTVKATIDPSNQVYIAPMSFWYMGKTFMEFYGGLSPIITPVENGSRWVIVCLSIIDNKPKPILIYGDISIDEPELPQQGQNDLPLAAILLKNDVKITNDMIFDMRNIINFSEEDFEILTPQIIYVNKNRTENYIADGSIKKPFKALQEAFTSISSLVNKRVVIDVAPGIYEETFELTINGSSIRINLNEALLKGDFTLNDITNDVQLRNKGALKIVGIGVRSSYNNTEFSNNCIEGNFIYNTAATNNMQTRLDFVNSGVVGNVTANGGGQSRLWTFWTNSSWSGLMSASTEINACGIIVNAFNSNSSGSNSIGSASGKVAAYNLYNCVISGSWNVSINQPGTWRNVIWKKNCDFTNYIGAIDVDSNSAASFLSKASNINGLTFTFADKANTIAYVPTNLNDWDDPKPTTITEAIDRIVSSIKTINGGNAI